MLKIVQSRPGWQNTKVLQGRNCMGSGWANPRAPNLGGTQAKANIFLKRYSILLIHNIMLYLRAPSNPLERVNFGCPSLTSLGHLKFWVPPSIVQKFSLRGGAAQLQPGICKKCVFVFQIDDESREDWSLLFWERLRSLDFGPDFGGFARNFK